LADRPEASSWLQWQGFSEYTDAMTFLYNFGKIPDADRRYLKKTIPMVKQTTNVNVNFSGLAPLLSKQTLTDTP
jgi:hypothetical protein